MVTRRVYLRNLSDIFGILPHDGGRDKFIIRNEHRDGIVLTNPKLRRSISEGVFFDDYDTTGEYLNNAIFTKNSYKSLGRGGRP